MLTEHEPTGWVSCPCPEDPSWEAGTAQYAMTKLENVSVAGLCIVLHRQPRPGMLLTIEFLRAPKSFAPPVTARVMQLPRNSLPSLLGRIEPLLGRSLEDPELRLSLQIALKIRHLLAKGS